MNIIFTPTFIDANKLIFFYSIVAIFMGHSVSFTYHRCVVLKVVHFDFSSNARFLFNTNIVYEGGPKSTRANK